jgi:small subunit ribosomal protein S20
VGDGDTERADGELRTLISTIDRAVKRGALHANNGARKKSRAAKLRARLG